jgi:membrane protein implicated in regulation of membrane protease activity
VIEVNRLVAGLIAYVVLGILVWTTLSDPRIRFVTLAILAMFAVKTWVRRKDFLHPDKGSDTSDGPL